MYKATQDAQHLQRREGSFSTVPSARGVNLLGWEEPEALTPEEQRKALGRRVGQIQAFLAAHKDIEGTQRWKFIKEMTKLIDQIRKLKPAGRACKKDDVVQCFMDVARERLTRPEFQVWLVEARERARAAARETEPIAGLHSEPLLKDKKTPASMNSLPVPLSPL